MFLKRSMISSSALLALCSLCLLLGTNSRGLAAAQSDPARYGFCEAEVDFGEDVLTNFFTMITGSQKSVPRTCVDVGGRERCFFTYVPTSCASSELKVPLVVDVHSYIGCPRFHIGYSGWVAKSEEECFVVVMPIGNVPSDEIYGTCHNLPGFARSDDFETEGGNNITTSQCCCFSDETSQAPDVDLVEYYDPLFFKTIIDTVLGSFETIAADAGIDTGLSVDADRVYMTGHSNGCVAGLSTAALYSDTVAAVCCHAGALATPFAIDYAPVPIWLVHGKLDDTFPYDGLVAADIPGIGLIGSWSIPQVQDYLSAKNGCEGNSVEPLLDITTGAVIGSTYRGFGCDDNASVEVVTLNDSGHRPMLIANDDFRSFVSQVENLTTIDTTGLAWEFCSAQTKASPPIPIECGELGNKKGCVAENGCSWFKKKGDKKKKCNEAPSTRECKKKKKRDKCKKVGCVWKKNKGKCVGRWD